MAQVSASPARRERLHGFGFVPKGRHLLVEGAHRPASSPGRSATRIPASSTMPAPWPRGARSRDIVFRGRGRVRRPPHPFRVERLCDPFAFLNFGVTGTRLSQRGRDRWSVSTLYAGHVAARRISLST